jgi:hypothetical protein
MVVGDICPAIFHFNVCWFLFIYSIVIKYCIEIKIIGIYMYLSDKYLSNKALSRSLCKGQGHSMYTLYVKQSFNDHYMHISLWSSSLSRCNSGSIHQFYWIRYSCWSKPWILYMISIVKCLCQVNMGTPCNGSVVPIGKHIAISEICLVMLVGYGTCTISVSVYSFF